MKIKLDIFIGLTLTKLVNLNTFFLRIFSVTLLNTLHSGIVMLLKWLIYERAYSFKHILIIVIVLIFSQNNYKIKI